MDVNYFLEREQIERVRAARAATREAREAHWELAAGYRARIDEYRETAVERMTPQAPLIAR